MTDLEVPEFPVGFWTKCSRCELQKDDPRHICGRCNHAKKDHVYGRTCKVENCLAFDEEPCHNFDCRDKAWLIEDEARREKATKEYAKKTVQLYYEKHKSKWYW